jgi:hypothetical protein
MRFEKTNTPGPWAVQGPVGGRGSSGGGGDAAHSTIKPKGLTSQNTESISV